MEQLWVDFYSTLLKNLKKMNLEKLISEKSATIIDVRSPSEFATAHAEEAINIPLNEIENRLDEIKQLSQPLILCCASGGRSAIATQMLTNQGFECYNAGSWSKVNKYQTQKDY
jgi:rhodanese-related sulfurtransferase